MIALLLARDSRPDRKEGRKENADNSEMISEDQIQRGSQGTSWGK